MRGTRESGRKRQRQAQRRRVETKTRRGDEHGLLPAKVTDGCICTVGIHPLSMFRQMPRRCHAHAQQHLCAGPSVSPVCIMQAHICLMDRPGSAGWQTSAMEWCVRYCMCRTRNASLIYSW